MQFTVLEILYMVLAFAILLLAVNFAVFLSAATKVMRNVEKMTEKTDNILGTAEQFVQMPLAVVQKIMEKVEKKKKHSKEEEEE